MIKLSLISKINRPIRTTKFHLSKTKFPAYHIIKRPKISLTFTIACVLFGRLVRRGRSKRASSRRSGSRVPPPRQQNAAQLGRVSEIRRETLTVVMCEGSSSMPLLHIGRNNGTGARGRRRPSGRPGRLLVPTGDRRARRPRRLPTPQSIQLESQLRTGATGSAHLVDVRRRSPLLLLVMLPARLALLVVNDLLLLEQLMLLMVVMRLAPHQQFRRDGAANRWPAAWIAWPKVLQHGQQVVAHRDGLGDYVDATC